MREKAKTMNDAYEQLADLLEYPEVNWAPMMKAYANIDPPEPFESFRTGIEELSLSHLQELYTRTFDLNPVCALEVGYHLFGENYKRGEFLANLRQTEAPFDLGQEHQLPDYLPVLLRLLTKLEDEEELRASLISECLIPAIGKMLAPLQDGENPYRYLLETVRTALRSEVGVHSSEPAVRASFARVSLPILTNDPRINTNAYEMTRTRRFDAPDFGVASCDFVDRRPLDSNPNPDLF